MFKFPESEKHKQGGRVDQCKKVEMIMTSVLRGDGTEAWPYYHEITYFDLDGNLKWIEDTRGPTPEVK